MHVVQQNLPTLFTVPVLVLYFLFNIGQILRRNITLQILGELLRGSFQVLLIILEDHRLIILPQIVRKHVGAHQRLATLAQDVDGLLQKLDLNPGHVVLLHLFHFGLDRGVQFVFKLQRLHVVHVTVVVVQVSG